MGESGHPTMMSTVTEAASPRVRLPAAWYASHARVVKGRSMHTAELCMIWLQHHRIPPPMILTLRRRFLMNSSYKCILILLIKATNPNRLGLHILSHGGCQLSWFVTII
jgi:hypothetical protein